MDAFLQDVRFAFRHIRRSPAFSVVAILTLALGIGANTATFTMLNALVLQRLPIADPDGLIAMTSRDARGRERYIPFPAINELTREGPLVNACGYNGGVILPMEANGAPLQALVGFVSGRCFDAFGVRPILGRAFVDADAPLVAAGNRVVLIGHRFWTRVYGADPAAVGKTIRTDGVDATIIGVLPPGFGGLHVDAGLDVFAPPDSLIPARGDRRPVATEVLGRLRPGVTLEQAQAEMSARWPALLKASLPPDSNPLEGASLWGEVLHLRRIGTGLSTYRERYAPALTMVFGLTALLLVLACVNLGGLLLTRLTARSTELAVRLALGGSRARIVTQMLVEGVVLSLCGAALAVPVSLALTTTLASFIPYDVIVPTISFTPDPRVLLLTAAVGVVVGVLVAAMPTWIAMRRRGVTTFTWDRTIAGTTTPWSRALLVTQVALSVAMVVGAGVLVRSLYLLQHIDLGLRTDGVLSAKLIAAPNNGGGGAVGGAYYRTLMEKAAALPGVRAVALSQAFPHMALEPQTPVTFVGEPPSDVRALPNTASPEFFDLTGIPLIAGRQLSWTDTPQTRLVCVVSESLARALSPDGNVLERRVNFGTNRETQDIVIVGVVGNASAGNPRLNAVPALYFAPLQRRLVGPNILVATTGDTTAARSALGALIRNEGREFVREIVTLDEFFTRAPSTERMSATFAAGVGGLAILLALIGVYGTLAYSVSRRTREIGVRVALGAAPRRVARAVVREGLLLTSIGVAVGLPLAALTARTLRALTYGISPLDPATFIGATIFFVVLGVVAGIAPALRAARVDPMVALRAE